jgi:hypothetical protein
MQGHKLQRINHYVNNATDFIDLSNDNREEVVSKD